MSIRSAEADRFGGPGSFCRFVRPRFAAGGRARASELAVPKPVQKGRPYRPTGRRTFCPALKRQAAGGDPNGALAQLGEHLLCKQGVIGSIPISSTIFVDLADLS